MRRTKEDAELTKRTIIRSAFRVFARRGFRETTLDHIATEAGVTRGAIYGHFRNKADLYNCLLQEVLPGYRAYVDGLFDADGSPLTRIRHFITRLLAFVDEDEGARNAAEVFLNADKTEECYEVLGEFREYEKLIEKRLADLIRQGIDNGEISSDISPDIAAFVLNKSLNGIILGIFGDREPYSPTKMANEIADFLLKGMVKK